MSKIEIPKIENIHTKILHATCNEGALNREERLAKKIEEESTNFNQKILDINGNTVWIDGINAIQLIVVLDGSSCRSKRL